MGEIDWTQPSREADAWIAEHVMGWTDVRLDQKFGEVDQWRGYNPKSTYAWCVLPWYTRNIVSAWEVFDSLGPGWQVSQTDHGGWENAYRWWCWLPEMYGSNSKICMAPTAPLAICCAAHQSMQGAPE